MVCSVCDIFGLVWFLSLKTSKSEGAANIWVCLHACLMKGLKKKHITSFLTDYICNHPLMWHIPTDFRVTSSCTILVLFLVWLGGVHFGCKDYPITLKRLMTCLLLLTIWLGRCNHLQISLTIKEQKKSITIPFGYTIWYTIWGMSEKNLKNWHSRKFRKINYG